MTRRWKFAFAGLLIGVVVQSFLISQLRGRIDGIEADLHDAKHIAGTQVEGTEMLATSATRILDRVEALERQSRVQEYWNNDALKHAARQDALITRALRRRF